MSEQQVINSMANGKVRITARDFARKMRNKQEVYHFLTHDCAVYLPAYDTVTVWHMRDLVAGKRLRINAKEIKHLNVPQYEDLKIEEFYKFAVEEEVKAERPGYIMVAFPLEEQERLKLPRQYIINVIYTLAGQKFRTFVDALVDKRHNKVAETKQMYIELDQEIAEMFNQSSAVSTSQGSSFNLMKASAKRRRSKKQIEKEKLEEEAR